jgi:phage FluMu gp28-like protein
VNLPAKYFMPYQRAWILDQARLKICEKGRQIGLSYADSYDSVRKAALKNGRDVWVMSRDEVQAKQYILYCKRWAKALNYACEDHGEQMLSIEGGNPVRVQVITFTSGASIYALSSNPDAIVGKTGHVKLDEFALHKDQRQLYAVAKPVIQWGGTLSIISTHRGIGTVFNEIILDIKVGTPGRPKNPMGWSLHSIPIQKAVEEGIVEKILAAAPGEGPSPTREQWLAQQRSECLDEEQWLQEYCCIPADEASAFLSYEMIGGCEDPNLRLLSIDQLIEYCLAHSNVALYAGVDVARKKDLFVLDVGEKVGDVMHDRVRLELQGKTFSQIEEDLFRVLRLPQIKRCDIDATGMGMQLAERAVERFAWKVEPVTFTAPVKEELAYGLRADFEDKKLRIVRDDKLRADLRGIKKEVTISGNIRFVGESEDSHCDRFWAKALRQAAARTRVEIGAMVG